MISAIAMPWDAPSDPGHRLSREQVVFLTPAHWSGMLSVAEAAAMVRKKPGTIRQWLFRKRIFPDGLDERQRPLFKPETVRAAERLVRENGIRGNGWDPRREKPKPQAPVDLERPAPAADAA